MFWWDRNDHESMFWWDGNGHEPYLIGVSLWWLRARNSLGIEVHSDMQGIIACVAESNWNRKHMRFHQSHSRENWALSVTLSFLSTPLRIRRLLPQACLSHHYNFLRLVLKVTSVLGRQWSCLFYVSIFSSILEYYLVHGRFMIIFVKWVNFSDTSSENLNYKS